MSSLRVEPLPDVRALIGEGPLWEESEQTLLFVDIMGKKIHRWSSASNQIASLDTGEAPRPVGFAVAAQGGGYVAGVGRSFSSVDWSTGAVTSLVTVDDDKPQNRLNDGKVDPTGRLFAGTMGLEQSPGQVQMKQGALFSLDSELKLQKLLDQYLERLDWSSDGKLFFYVDSLEKSVDVLIMTSGPETSVRTIYYSVLIVRIGPPDGLTLDSDGNIWVSCYDGGRVLKLHPQTGTSAKFDSRVFRCAAADRLSAQPLAGATFRVSGLGVKGRPPVEFSGTVLK
uniref:SMP-30/Gluconolactonase/LRE-like region domain-containing protein n=1 Tax=Neogobius melanostomus TaxID=47308 RepID=A0A8C6SJB6_9GOBI